MGHRSLKSTSEISSPEVTTTLNTNRNFKTVENKNFDKAVKKPKSRSKSRSSSKSSSHSSKKDKKGKKLNSDSSSKQEE